MLLPSRIDGQQSQELPECRQIIIVGGSGAGKTRFMNALVDSYGPRAFSLSALGSITSEEGGSVDALFAEHLKGRPALPEARRLTDLDKLTAILFQDEFRYLLSVKSARLIEGRKVQLEPTRLDKLIKVWQSIFPGNTVMREAGRFLFATQGGPDPIGTMKLSEGEKAVLYYISAVLYAPKDGVIFVDAPGMFVHPAMLHTLWDAVEGLRPDCVFVYNTSDMEFISSRTQSVCIWVKRHDAKKRAWDYEILKKGTLPEDLSTCLLGTRRPVLFIEGDAVHSIDMKLYPLVFPGHTVRPLGSCNKVIETVRSFCDMRPMHHLESHGIVDRDRRTVQEVEYLRSKNVMVPEVAEVENIFMLEAVIKIMAKRRGRNPQRVADKVRKAVINMFGTHFREQVLQHVRHRMKRQLETRGDCRAKTIGELEEHLRSLPQIIDVRAHYNALMSEFGEIAKKGDYAAVLRVFNHKPMLNESQVSNLLGFRTKDDYIAGVLGALKEDTRDADALRRAIRAVFQLN